MPFSAGTIFLDVVPNFNNIQRRTATAARGIGKPIAQEMERTLQGMEKDAAQAGAKSGEKYGNSFQKTLSERLRRAASGIEARVDVNSRPAELALASLRKEMLTLADKTIGVDIDAAEAMRELNRLERELRQARDENVDIDIRTNAGQAVAELEAVRRAARDSLVSKDDLARAQQDNRIYTDTVRREAKLRADAERQSAREAAEAQRQAAKEAADAQRNMYAEAYQSNRVFNDQTRQQAKLRAEIEKQAAKEAADVQRQMYAEAYQSNKVFNDRAKSDRAARLAAEKLAAKQEASARKEAERDVTSNLRNEVAQRAALAAAAALAQQEASDRAARTGNQEDIGRAVAAIAARYRAEGELAQAAARQRIQAAARGYAGEVAAAKMAEQQVKESDRDKTDAMKRQTAERIALARLEGAVAKNMADRQSGVANWTGQAANAFRFFNGYLLTAITLGPLLIPVLAALTAGVGALGVAFTGAVFGLGAMIAGFSGIGGALTAMSGLEKEKRKQSSGSGASNPEKDTRALRDAQLALARAREDSGRRIASAAATQANAERSLTKAVQDATKAQQDLIDARRQAAEDLEDQNNRLKSGLLDEQLGAFRLQEAGYRLNNVLEDPQATEREKRIAQLEYDQQVQQYKELQTQNRRLERDVAEANRKGVEGSDAVVAAKENIVSANENVSKAERDLSDAQSEVARARVEESRTLMDAEQRVADAIIDLQAKSVEAGVAGSAAMDAFNESMRNLSPTAQEFARFLYGLKPLLDDLRFAAQEGLLPGVQDAIQMLVDTYGPDLVDIMSSVASAVGDVFRLLGQTLTSPFFVELFDMMADLAPDFIRDFGQIAVAVLEIFGGLMKAFAPIAVELSDFFVDMAQGVADWAKGLADDQGFASFLEYVEQVGPQVAALLGNLLEIVLNLVEGMAPYASDLLDMAVNFTAWLAAMDPDTLAKVAGAVMLIVGALQAFAGVMSIVASVGQFLTLFGGGAAAATVAVPAVEGGVAAGGVAAGAASGPVGWVVLAIVAAILAIIAFAAWLKHLYDTSEEFKAKWDKLWENVSKAVGAVVDRIKEFFEDAGFSIDRLKDTYKAFYETVVVPISDAIGVAVSAVSEVWTTVWGVMSAAIKAVWDALVAFYEKVIVPVFTFIGQILDVFWQVVSTVFNMVWQIIVYVLAPIFQWLYESIVKPVFGWIGDRISWVWENMIKPVFNALKDFIEKYVAPGFQAGVDAIARIWETLIDIAKMPIEFVVNTVINKGIIDNFNKLVDIFPGMTKVDHITLPWAEGSRSGGGGGGGRQQAVATGGILPGYTPGRDVHRFVSPSAGTLLLSGGEGILRPELTAAIGKRRWDAANKAARAGDITGGLEALGLGGFSTGGVFGRFTGGAFADGGILGWLSDAAGGANNIISDALGGVRDIAGAILAAPAKMLRGVVDALLPDSPTGIMGIGVGMVNKVLDGVIGSIEGMKSSRGGTEGDPAYTGAQGEGGIGMGYQAQIATLHSAFPDARITSSYRPGAITAVGTQSYHGKGRAIDIAPSWAIFDWLASNFPNSRELIYSPAGERQILNGRNYNGWAPVTRSMHYNHIHWAMKDGGVVPNLYDSGGYLPPGLSLVANKTGKPEPVFTHEQGQALSALARENSNREGGGVNFYGDVNGGDELARKIADRIETRRRDAAATSGINKIGVSW